MKKLMMIAVAFIMSLSLCGCNNANGSAANEIKNEENNEMQASNLVTVDELLEKCKIPTGEYPTEEIQAFISECELTPELIDKLNIKLLLDDFCKQKHARNVENVFNSNNPVRKDNYTEDIEAIAFYVNRNTGIKCVYYDVKEGKMYLLKEGYLFDDLNKVQAESIGDCRELIKKIDNMGVFEWKSASDTEDVVDPQSMGFAVVYEDGTFFNVSASGVVSRMMPDNYSFVEDLLLREEE